MVEKDFLARISIEETERHKLQHEVHRVICDLKEKQQVFEVHLIANPTEKATSSTHVFQSSTPPLVGDARSKKSSIAKGVIPDESDDLIILEVVEPENSNTYPSFGESSLGLPRDGRVRIGISPVDATQTMTPPPPTWL